MNIKKFLWAFVSPALFAASPQYKSPDITILAASADEPVLEIFSLAKANDYLEKGALAWTRKRGCVTCHTTGTYMQIRPMLTPVLGKPHGGDTRTVHGRTGKIPKTQTLHAAKGHKAGRDNLYRGGLGGMGSARDRQALEGNWNGTGTHAPHPRR